MRLGVGKPPLGVGWGVGARWSDVRWPRVTQFQAKTNKSGNLAPRMQGLNVEFLVPVLVRLRKKSTKGMLRNQTCKRLLNNRFV